MRNWSPTLETAMDLTTNRSRPTGLSKSFTSIRFVLTMPCSRRLLPRRRHGTPSLRMQVQICGVSSTSGSMLVMSVLERATSMSHIRWRLNQQSGVVPKARPGRSAVSAVIERRGLMIALMRIGGTPIVLARRYWLMPSSSMKSAKRSPGWIGSGAFVGLPFQW